MGQQDKRPDVELFLDDHRGIYIPRDFAQSIDPVYWFGVSAENLAILANPEHDDYWEAWDEVRQDAFGILPPAGSRFGSTAFAVLESAHAAELAGNLAERDRLIAALCQGPMAGVRWNLYQDGALWIVPHGMEMRDNGEWYWPDETSPEDDQ